MTYKSRKCKVNPMELFFRRKADRQFDGFFIPELNIKFDQGWHGLKYFLLFLNLGIGGGGDSTLVVLVTGHLDEAFISPFCTPGVLDKPVILALFDAITDSQNTMVEVHRAAVGFVINAFAVELERGLGSINGNRDGSNSSQGSLETFFITLGNINESNVGCTFVFPMISASIIHAFVGIALFGVNTSVLLNVFESKVHKTTIAAMVAVTGRAIDQVLLAQRNKFSCFTEMLTFQRSGGAK